MTEPTRAELVSRLTCIDCGCETLSMPYHHRVCDCTTCDVPSEGEHFLGELPQP